MAQDLNRSIKIYIDNSDALAKTEELEKKMSSLREEMRKLDAEGQKETKQYTAKEKALKNMERTYGSYENKLKETQRVLKNLSGSTYQELLTVRRTVQRELRNEQRGTEAYTAKLKTYQAVQVQITAAQREMNGTLGIQPSLWSRATDGFNKYFGIVSAFMASVTGLSLAFRKLSQDAAAMEDVYADVMKTTGMTREGVEDLNNAFKQLSTRTSREELNNLARDAGKLGLTSRKDILDFVEAGNQINVALGEDLGEGAIKNIGKMSDVFKLSTKELRSMDLKEQMLSIGSAINELGQSSTASEPYLVSFTQRLGGVASQAGISIQNVMGYASALDQSGQAIEMSATAFQKFIMQLMSDTETFARIAGLEVDKFNKILKNDTNEAIKTVLKAMSEKGGFQQLIPIFQEMGMDGARAVGVLSSLATNIDKVDEAQTIANDSFREAISLTNEYSVKNENAQAKLEKQRKAFKDAALELGQRLNPALLKSTNIMTYIVKAMPAFLDFMFKYGKYIAYLATAYSVYAGSVKLSVAWTKLLNGWTVKQLALYYKELVILKAKAAWNHTVKVSTLALAAAKALLTGNITRMHAAWKLLNATMIANPFGLLITAISGLIFGIVKLVKHLTQYNDKATAMAEINKRVAETVRDERAELDLLLGVAKNEKISKEQRAEAIERLNEISPEYLGNLSLENINTKEATTSVKEYTAALMENARQKAVGDKVSELYGKRLELEAKMMSQQADFEKRRNAGLGRSDIDRIIEGRIDRYQKQLDKIDEEIDMYNELNQSMEQNTRNRKLSYADNLKLATDNLNNSIEVLDNLEAEHARIYETMKENESAFSRESDFVSKNRLSQLNLQIEAQKTLVAEKKKELELLQQEGDKQVQPDAPDTSSAGIDKDYYKNKLAALQQYIEQEKNVLLQSLLDKQITQEAYNRQLEHLERERLQRTLEIYNLEPAKRVEVENLLLENKIKALKLIEDAEREHQTKLLEMQQAADKARQEQNWNALKAIADKNKEQWDIDRQEQHKRQAELAALGMDFADEMGTLIGGAMSGNEDMVNASLKSIISMALDALKLQVQMAVAGATALSLAQPDSVATFGASGFARAAILVGLIEAAFSAVKGVVNSAIGGIGSSSGSASASASSSTTRRIVDQRAKGKYDVIGADDGRHYSVPYLGVASTGMVTTPALVGEYGPELIVSAPDFGRLQRHINYPLVLQAIQESRVPQRARGNYSALPPSPSSQNSTGVQLDAQVLNEIVRLLRSLNQNGVAASITYRDIERAQQTVAAIRNRAGR